MRLFIGIPLAAAVTEQLARLRARFERPEDGLRWSSPESWHITLQFLGATTELQYACLVERLESLIDVAVPIRIEGLGFFDRAGVFFVGVPVSPQLTSLQQSVTHATSQCGLVPEDRPYHPHITLARQKGQSGGIRSLKSRVDAMADQRFSAFSAHELLLYESFLGPSGSRYEIRVRFPLTSK
jgi:2'-5' RNA ligase